MLTQFGHITILVKDYDEALSFYTKKLGFTKLSDNTFGPGIRWITVAPNQESQTAIVFVKADTPEKIVAIGKQAPNHVLLTLHTNNIDQDFKELKTNGVKFHGRPKEVPWGKEVVFEDLYGNLFDLVALP